MDADRILFLAAVVAFTLIAAVVDVRSRTIPNWLTVPAFLAGVAFHCFHSGWHGLGLSLGGFATGFCLLLVLMAVGGGGGGDVKLMGALGAWLGWKAFLAVFVLGTVFVVIGSVFVIALQAMNRRSSAEPEPNAPAGAEKNSRPDTRIQITYALPVALATWLVLAWIMISKHDGLFAHPDHRVSETKTSQRGASGAKASALWEGPLKSAAELTYMKSW
jgi:prepilin peptidase CpaA